MPREDGSQPLVQTRQSGKDLYVYPEGAVKALAAGLVDRELFNVTGLVRQGYDDAHTKKLPLIAVYDGSVNVARTAPPDFIDLTGAYRPIGSAVYFGGIETVAAPGTRTEYDSAGDTAWDQMLSSSFRWGEFMVGERRTYTKGQKTKASWYEGITGPVAPRDLSGKETLAAERQGNLIGFAPAMWGDGAHAAQPGSFGDIGGLQLERGGEVVGDSWYPFGVFEIPAEESRYELTQNIEKIGPPARVCQRSTSVLTTWGFTSKLDASAYSQGLPVLFPRYAAPLDGMKTVAAANGQSIGLGVTGHAGYESGALKTAKLSYSYDGENWRGRGWARPAAAGPRSWTTPEPPASRCP